MWLLTVGIAYSGCESPAKPADVEAAMNAVENALEAGDGMAFTRARGDLTQSTECLDARLEPKSVARLFRTEGLYSYVTGRNDRAADFFVAARRLEPDAPLPIYPEGHEAHQLYLERDPTALAFKMLPPPKGQVFLDGQEVRKLPVDAPTVFQLRDDRGTRFELLSAGEVPTYSRRRPIRTALAATGGVSLVSSIISWGISSTARSRFNRPNQTEDALRTHRSNANLAGASAVTFAVVAIASGTGAILINR